MYGRVVSSVVLQASQLSEYEGCEGASGLESLAVMWCV